MRKTKNAQAIEYHYHVCRLHPDIRYQAGFRNLREAKRYAGALVAFGWAMSPYTVDIVEWLGEGKPDRVFMRWPAR
jgi:hypothetical protein